jgi:hypothetical protein
MAARNRVRPPLGAAPEALGELRDRGAINDETL